MTVQAAQLLGAALSTIGLAGCGLGIGVVFGGLLISVAMNPHIKDELFQFAMLGFALTEAIALFSLMLGFLVLYN